MKPAVIEILGVENYGRRDVIAAWVMIIATVGALSVGAITAGVIVFRADAFLASTLILMGLLLASLPWQPGPWVRGSRRLALSGLPVAVALLSAAVALTILLRKGAFLIGAIDLWILQGMVRVHLHYRLTHPERPGDPKAPHEN